MKVYKLIIFCLIFLCLVSCQKVYDGKEVTEIIYETIDYNGGVKKEYKIDFINNKAYKKGPYINDDSSQYEVINTFTEDEEITFINNIYLYGLFDINSSYSKSDVIDGGGWNLVIKYVDGEEKKSTGDNAVPSSIFNKCALSFYSLCKEQVLGIISQSFFNAPSLSFSYSYEKNENSYQTNELRKVVKANYSWNDFSQKDIDIYTLNESIKNNQELLDDVEYNFILYTIDYNLEEYDKFKKCILKSYDYNNQLSNEKILFESKWFTSKEIILELEKIYVYTLEFKNGDYVEYTFNTKTKDVYYSVSIIDEDNLISNKDEITSKKYESNTIITLYANLDETYELFANDTLLNSNNNIYYFEITSKDVLIQYKKINNSIEPIIIKPAKESKLHESEILGCFENNKYENKQFKNYTDETLSDNLSFDIFSLSDENNITYFVKINNQIYNISIFDFNMKNNSTITSVCLSDINNDGYYEVSSSIVSYKMRDRYLCLTSFIMCIDTKTNEKINNTIYNDIAYFKLDENKNLGIYITNKEDSLATLLTDADIKDGILDEKYYDMANYQYEKIVKNNAIYNFSNLEVNGSCELFDVVVSIKKRSIEFPFYMEKSYDYPSFEVSVDMTYKGETFSYISGDNYLDGAMIYFINGDKKIICEPWFACEVVTNFIIYKGMVISNTYYYNDTYGSLNSEGTYDMLITYQGNYITINDVLTIYR